MTSLDWKGLAPHTVAHLTNGIAGVTMLLHMLHLHSRLTRERIPAPGFAWHRRVPIHSNRESLLSWMGGLVNARLPGLAAAVAAAVVFVRNRALLLKSADIAVPYLSR